MRVKERSLLLALGRHTSLCYELHETYEIPEY